VVSPLRLISIRLMALLAVLGPGFITANVDNDPGGILTYSQIREEFGLRMTFFTMAAILPLATVYNICEGLGFESGIDRRFGEARIFYSLYAGLIVFGAGFVLIPRLPLLQVMLVSQVANGILLPFVLIFMLVLVNKKSLMGSDCNGTWTNVTAISTSVVMIGLTGALI